MLVTTNSAPTGAQIRRSALLGVNRFSTRLTDENATTTQTSHWEAGVQLVRITFARAITTPAIATRRAA